MIAELAAVVAYYALRAEQGWDEMKRRVERSDAEAREGDKIHDEAVRLYIEYTQKRAQRAPHPILSMGLAIQYAVADADIGQDLGKRIKP